MAPGPTVVMQALYFQLCCSKKDDSKSQHNGNWYGIVWNQCHVSLCHTAITMQQCLHTVYTEMGETCLIPFEICWFYTLWSKICIYSLCICLNSNLHFHWAWPSTPATTLCIQMYFSLSGASLVYVTTGFPRPSLASWCWASQKKMHALIRRTEDSTCLCYSSAHQQHNMLWKKQIIYRQHTVANERYPWQNVPVQSSWS